ncbi:MAG TPA: AI-2E family transporter [Vicinamibacterales bacterium]|nr:AI-2E family transporter [Vicinamibacterales bacterium]
MVDALKSSWLTFAGCVLVVAVLYWAQAVLVPVALAVLITFVLTPPVVWLQRWLGRIPAVLMVVVLVFGFLGLAGYGVYRQMTNLADALPTYRTNIREKIHDIRGAQSGGSVARLEKTVDNIKGDLGSSSKPKAGTAAQPLVVTTAPVAGLSGIGWLGPVVEPLGTAGFVITLVLFMLLDREDLRDRMIKLVGHGQLAVTTKAMDEAGSRVSRQLLLQTLVNAIYGTLAAAGLYLLGVPYPLFWGALGAALRFIPYVGPVIAAGGPILLALAALPGWTRPLEVVAFYVVLETFTNLALETMLYSGAAGVSPVALLIAVAFWTWLWGPLGLLMATPLTVCLVVIGKHVPALDFLGTLLSDAPALSAERSYYQRLLAGDEAEAAELVERYLKAQPAETVYDGMLVPALTYAERDRLEGRLSPDEETAVVETTGDMLELLAEAAPPAPARAMATRVLAYPVNGAPDALALRMLAQLAGALPVQIDIVSTRLLASELVTRVRADGYAIVCLADLPPSAPSKTRYLVRKLRAALPDMRIVVGRWAPAELADETLQPLTDAGASHVASTLMDTRAYLAEAAHVSTTGQVRDTPDAA